MQYKLIWGCTLKGRLLLLIWLVADEPSWKACRGRFQCDKHSKIIPATEFCRLSTDTMTLRTGFKREITLIMDYDCGRPGFPLIVKILWVSVLFKREMIGWEESAWCGTIFNHTIHVRMLNATESPLTIMHHCNPPQLNPHHQILSGVT